MQQEQAKKRKVLIAITGSVAAIKVTEMVQSLLPSCELKLLMTQSAKKFIRQEEIEELSLLYHVECLEDEDEQLRWGKRGDPILHIELRKWADALIIAPLSANTLAKITNGQCDNLVTLVCRCWDMKLRSSQDTGEERPRQVKLAKPIIVAPAMNTMMWEHPITEEQLDRLRSWGYTIANPIEKLLMCGDQGRGAMAHIETITAALSAQLSQLQAPEQI